MASDRRLHGTPLGYCIRGAYGVQPYQIAGPSWMDPPTDGHFDIDAKAASPAQEAQLKLMLQELPADRLKLAMHREKRDMQVYAMVAGKNGPKFQNSKTAAMVRFRRSPTDRPWPRGSPWHASRRRGGLHSRHAIGTRPRSRQEESWTWSPP
jgi:uncharacterized protein (TIGR03435 family)